MPQINRVQNKPQQIKTPQTNGSVLDRAIDVANMGHDFMRVCLYGVNRCGKTTLASLFPKPLLLVAMEPNLTGGSASVRHIPGVKHLLVNNIKDAVYLAQELKEREHPYKTVVLDSATSLQDIALAEILGVSSIPEILSWGSIHEEQYRARSEKAREVMRPYLTAPMHTVVLVKEKDHNRDMSDRRPSIVRGQWIESMMGPDLGGATAKWLADVCDCIVRLSIEKETKEQVTTTKVNGKLETTTEQIETGKTIRRLRTVIHPNYICGIRSPNPECVPEYIDCKVPQDMYDKLMLILRGEYKMETKK